MDWTELTPYISAPRFSIRIGKDRVAWDSQRVTYSEEYVNTQNGAGVVFYAADNADEPD
jgi:hypothetical protein